MARCLAAITLADVHEANIHEANVHEANIHEADVHEADVHEANIHEANVHEANIHEVDVHSFMHALNKDEHHCIMEATGNYCVTLLYMLDKGGYRVSLINPLKTQNFAKTELSVTKTDAEDAKLLSRYGQEKQPPVYKMPTETILILKQKRTVLRQLKKQHTMLTNMQQSLDVLPVQDPLSKNAVKKVIISIEKQIRALEEDMTNITKKEYKHQLELLTSIKGINNKIASALITATGGFTYFDNAKQFSRYLGLCPTIIQSGSSVNVKGHINRNGDSYLRSQLFISAMPTMRFNKACRELYERLRANGISGKVENRLRVGRKGALYSVGCNSDRRFT